jgi:hypothetical protein
MLKVDPLLVPAMVILLASVLRVLVAYTVCALSVPSLLVKSLPLLPEILIPVANLAVLSPVAVAEVPTILNSLLLSAAISS